MYVSPFYFEFDFVVDVLLDKKKAERILRALQFQMIRCVYGTQREE